MTKAALKEKYTEWNKEISALTDRQDNIFHELQELCKEKGDGHKWCGLEILTEALVMAGQTFPAMQLVSEYYQIEGQKEALRKLAIATNNFEI